MSDCIFCKIAQKAIPTKFYYEDEMCVAFDDISPTAPTHILVVSKEHYSTMMDAPPEVLAAMCAAVNKLAEQGELAEKGFRLVINTHQDGGQTVPHLHMHMLGGREMTWPAG